MTPGTPFERGSLLNQCRKLIGVDRIVPPKIKIHRANGVHLEKHGFRLLFHGPGGANLDQEIQRGRAPSMNVGVNRSQESVVETLY